MREKRGLFVWSFGAENFVPRHSFFCLALVSPADTFGPRLFFRLGIYRYSDRQLDGTVQLVADNLPLIFTDRQCVKKIIFTNRLCDRIFSDRQSDI